MHKTGSGETLNTKARVKIYQVEGDVEPNTRGKSRENNLEEIHHEKKSCQKNLSKDFLDMMRAQEKEDVSHFNDKIHQENNFEGVISITKLALSNKTRLSREEAKRVILLYALKRLEKLHSDKPNVYILKYPSEDEFLIEYPEFKGSDELRAYANWMNFLFAEKIIKPNSNRGAILFGLSMALGKCMCMVNVTENIANHI